MDSRYLKTTNTSIRSQLASFTPERAFSEYVWNGFDANASEIKIYIETNELNGIDAIRILDNGEGIPFEELDSTFDLFLDSRKKSKFTVTTRGKKGKGRFSFFTFSERSKWSTWNNGTSFDLVINSSHLHRYDPSDPCSTERSGSGTEILFSPISIDYHCFNDEVIPYLRKEFTWLLLSNPKLSILVNDIPLSLMGYQSKAYEEQCSEGDFKVKSIIWDDKPSTEKSYVYFIDSADRIVHKALSELNYKGFCCSSYVKSSWLDGFSPSVDLFLSEKNTDSRVFNDILSLARNKLRQEYNHHRNSAADQLIDQYIKEGVFPELKGDNRALNEFHREQLIATVKTIFEAEPAVFSKNLNKMQKKILIKLLDRIVQTNRLSELFDVLDGVISLSEEDISRISGLLQRTTLENITKTIEHIKDRCDVISHFETLIYDCKKFAFEVPHIQKCIESNLWLFGEQYHLLTAEEDKFDKALRALLEFHGDDHFDKYSINHPDKNKEMDIFAAQKGVRIADDGTEYFHHVVIELKRPSIKLSDKELDQIKRYKNVIASEPKFNDENMVWDFILVGNEISESKFTAANLRAEMESSRIHCEPGLVQKTDNMRIFVKTWKQVMNEFELRYSELSKRLQLKELEIVNSSPDGLTKSISALSEVT